MNSTIKVAAKEAEELTNQMRTVTKLGRQSTHKSKIRRLPTEKMGKQSNAWPEVYNIHMERQLISEEDKFLWLSRGDLKGETES
jgi:hypothetical protein